MRILSIDGGGIRGILPGMVVDGLEKRLQQRAGDSSVRISDYFDLVAGTSTGGILACLYLCPREPGGRPMFSASEAVDLYLERGDDIFDVSWWQSIRSVSGLRDEKYPADELEDALDDYLADRRLSQLLKPCLITAYDIRNRRAHFFKQHRAVSDGSDFFLRDVARATSAAPTYFEVARIKSDPRPRTQYALIDGGVFANNPALCAYAEARTFEVRKKNGGGNYTRCTAEKMFMLSLGTGKVEKRYTYKEAKDWGPLGWAKPVLDIMMSGVAETVDYQLGQIFGSVNKTGQYVRIEPGLNGASPDLDDASGDNLKALRRAGRKCVRKNENELDRVAEELFNWSYEVK